MIVFLPHQGAIEPKLLDRRGREFLAARNVQDLELVTVLNHWYKIIVLIE